MEVFSHRKKNTQETFKSLYTECYTNFVFFLYLNSIFEKQVKFDFEIVDCISVYDIVIIKFFQIGTTRLRKKLKMIKNDIDLDIQIDTPSTYVV